jgi:seryl-tRNA synthetase
MIDLFLLRERPQELKILILKKDPQFAVDTLIVLDKQVREIKQEVERLRAQKNELAKQAANKEQFETIRAKSIEIGKTLKTKEEELVHIEAQFHTLYLECPNIPDESVPFGSKADNTVVKTWGKPKTFDFGAQNHLELSKKGFINFDTAAKLSGAHFAFYEQEGAKLLYALSLFMLKHNMSYGFSLCLPPLLVKEEALVVSGNFPKFRDSVFYAPVHDLYLTPTSEVNLTNIYTNHIFSSSELPIRKTAWTSCFRTEGGGYGAQERGLIRLRQFEKVELVSFVLPEKSFEELDFMVSVAEGILQKLDLPYQISLLASGDCSFQSAKTYDIEVWLPGQKEYKEISSASNCTDFQARRGLIRYKKHPDDKATLLHTLNASSLALPRLMVAIMETYQNSDGSISIPEVLKPFYL